MGFKRIFFAVNFRLEKSSGVKEGCVCVKEKDKCSYPTSGLGEVQKNEEWSTKENLYLEEFKRARAKGGGIGTWKDLILESFLFSTRRGDIPS